MNLKGLFNTLLSWPVMLLSQIALMRAETEYGEALRKYGNTAYVENLKRRRDNILEAVQGESDG